jgi:integrase
LQLIDEFVEDQTRSNTKKAYKGYTKKFKVFLQENNIVFDKDYVKILRRYDIDSEAMNNKYEVLKQFYKYLQKKYPMLDAKTKNYHKYCIIALFNSLEIDINSKTLDKKLTNKDEVVARDSEEGFDKEFVIKFLQHCDDTRLKTWVLFMAATGWRPVESLTLRWADLLDWENEDKKTRAYLHGDYTKTRRDRKRYITDELAEQLKIWKQEKYADKYTTQDNGNGKRKGIIDNKLKYNKRNLIFAKRNQNINPTTKTEMVRKTQSLYDTLLKKFFTVRNKLKIEEKNEDNGHNLFTPKSLRHYVKTEVSMVTRDPEYSEYFIGHHINYRDRGGQREIDNFAIAEKALTFLDPNILISYGQIDKKRLEELERKSKQIDNLTEELKQVKKETLLMKFDKIIHNLIEEKREGLKRHEGLHISKQEQYDYFVRNYPRGKAKFIDLELLEQMLENGEIEDYTEESTEELEQWG